MTDIKLTPLRRFDPKTLPRRKDRKPEPLPHAEPEGYRVSMCPDDIPKAVFWRGLQWAVTDYGVETWQNAPYHYFLKHDRLDEPHLPEHMREKDWVYISDFLAALRFARSHKF